MSCVSENFKTVLAKVQAAARAANRDPGEITLLAVSKTVDTPAVQELYDLGVREFGENRVPELLRKAELLPKDIRWHLIGSLQANKVRKALSVAAIIHSVNSAALLERIDRIAAEEGKCPEILLEVNVSGEESKSGCPLGELDALAAAADDCRNVRWRGLMTMAPCGAAEPELKRYFSALRTLRDGFETKFQCRLPVLSMGMSGDFETAIGCGATIVRVGTAIFREP